MSRYCSPFQGADSAGAPVSQHTAHRIQQFPFCTDHDDAQSTSNFAPLVKPHAYDHIRAPPQRSPSMGSSPFAETLSHEQTPSRGASPSPASLFSHQSSASSSYTHFSSSGVSLEVGSEREPPGPCPPSHFPSFRPTSPPARIGSPYNRPPSRIIARPGSPLVRHPAWINSAAVARPASRRSHRPGSQSIDHSIHQAMRQMNCGNTPPTGEKEPVLGDQRTSDQDGRKQISSGGNGAHETASAPTFSTALEQLEDAPQLRSEHPTHNSVPSPDSSSSQDTSTMTDLSDSDESSPRSPGTDEPAPEQAIRVLRTILEDEFDLRLGTCAPPEDMVSAVADCLNKIAISHRQCRLQGYLVPVNAVHDSNDRNTPEPTRLPLGGTNGGKESAGGFKKRGMSEMGRDDQDDEHEDEDGDDDAGGAGIDPNPAGDRKRPKFEAYACPFRKRNPTRFNIREWEYCAKAPFKSISELKKHLNKYHKQATFAYKCERCHMCFTSHENLKDHLRKDPSQMCEISSDRETSPTASSIEAVSSTVGDRFRARKEHFDWKGIWKALFPEDDPKKIPSPGEPPTFAAQWLGAFATHGLANRTAPQDFEPPVEIHEVIREFEGSLPALSHELSTHFRTGGEDSIDIAMEIFKRFAKGVFQRAQTQALAGTHCSTSPLSIQPYTQPPASNSSLAPPYLRTNAGTPSSTTTSSSGSRQRRSRTGGRSTADTSGASTPASQLRDSPSLAMTSRTSVSPRGQFWGTPGGYNLHGQPFLQSGFPPPTVSPLSNHSSTASMTAPALDPAFTMPIGCELATDVGVRTERFSKERLPAIRHPPGQEHGSPPQDLRQTRVQNQPTNPRPQPVPFDLQGLSQSHFNNTRNFPGHATSPLGSGSSAYEQGAVLGGQNPFTPWPNLSAQPIAPAPGSDHVPATTTQRYHPGAYVPDVLGEGGEFQFHGNNTSSISNMNFNNAYYPIANPLTTASNIQTMDQDEAAVMLASLNARLQKQ